MKIRAQGVSREFIRQGRGTNRFIAVQPLDLELHESKVTVIMGRSGSGKSTLLNILGGLLTPTTGKVFYDDTDIYAMSDAELSEFRSLHVGIIPQGQTPVQSLSVYENVCLSYILHSNDADKEKLARSADELMERLGIAGLKTAKPAELSGGELRRMSIARAMLRHPELILADEPTCDLDDENTELVLKVLREAADSGSTVLLVTHEREADKYADTVYRMDSGRLS